ncbi:extracellular catalytic domain type 1 short-chain-length polyhydroxyalkanoate depolymerase [Streptosporangium sp. OZ121]|uniref:extracellular catalytic domain type 1 short-chain-length polyhydroxyalkanoate depolymerase n=1 Tax=Streptosporangium sp. OZ121 TaxID=3444183 RepID=UPI003F7A8FCF
MKSLTAVLAGVSAAVLCAATFLVTGQSAAAATLTEVTGFGANPGNLRMHLYVPDTVQPSPAIVLAMHGCGGSGPGFYSGSEFRTLADRHGFIVIYPSASKKGNCFDSWSAASKVRDGGSDPVSLMSMITYTRQRHNGDADRIYVTGSSAGGMETNIMLGNYPDVFKAGAAFMGVPFGCFANEADYIPSPGASDCASGRISKTPQQWGDLVRAAYPGYNGPRPRVQLWHGTTDNLVYYATHQQAIDQWTNVFGLSQTPTSSDTPQPNWNRRRYADASGTVRVEAYSIQGAGHSLPMSGMAAAAIQFFGLTGGTSPSPTPTPTPSPTPTPTPSPTPTPTPTPDPGTGCRVTYLANTWNNGFTADVTVTNTGATPVNGWTVTWTWPGNQRVTSAWNATVTQSGSQVSARNLSYNGTIAPQARTGFGFQGTYSGTNSAPTAFALNGTSCVMG